MQHLLIDSTRADRLSRPAVRRRFAPLAFGVALLTALTVALARPAVTSAWTAGTFSSTSESLMVQLHNQARANAGLRALTVDSTLKTEARSRSKDMIDRNYFSHSIPPDGHKVFDELKAMGYCYTVAGENIGWNTYPDDTATQAMFDSFMGSSTHKANILGSWTVMGVGAYQGSTDKKMWTVLFAVPCSGSTPAPTPTPKATTKPTGTPRPATPRPTTPVTAPTAAPTAAPADPTAAPADPTAAPSEAPSEAPTLPPEDPWDPAFVPAFMWPPLVEMYRPDPAPSASPEPAGTALVEPGLRVVDSPSLQGLFETIVGGVTGIFFGS